MASLEAIQSTHTVRVPRPLHVVSLEEAVLPKYCHIGTTV
ncbi:hypothetical protein BIW11_02624 [Tropilaelaps mercedesae]|uniref:Uncharacterized protein n=1 Tax=Tropilaelaps mercedesae TaxID=418985 RepID=A0A1V9XZZ0_9ACAR|nr:hypothetical protein BIW11_02624 [Tropilaelaps mercedesae]